MKILLIFFLKTSVRNWVSFPSGTEEWIDPLGLLGWSDDDVVMASGETFSDDFPMGNSDFFFQ